MSLLVGMLFGKIPGIAPAGSPQLPQGTDPLSCMQGVKHNLASPKLLSHIVVVQKLPGMSKGVGPGQRGLEPNLSQLRMQWHKGKSRRDVLTASSQMVGYVAFYTAMQTEHKARGLLHNK